MTAEQINDAIAQSIQWTGSYHHRPDYCGDLNAMWEAEAHLTPDQQVEFVYQLSEIVAPMTGDPWMADGMIYLAGQTGVETANVWKTVDILRAAADEMERLKRERVSKSNVKFIGGFIKPKEEPQQPKLLDDGAGEEQPW